APVTTPRLADYLMSVSPYSPHARSVLLNYDVPLEKKTVEQWGQTVGKHPRLLAALAYWYRGERNVGKAAEFFKKALAITHDHGWNQDLANLYLRQGKEDLWLQTMEESLKHPALGLEHAKVCVDISQHFRRKRDW